MIKIIIDNIKIHTSDRITFIYEVQTFVKLDRALKYNYL
jgi:hypothetical protein